MNTNLGRPSRLVMLVGTAALIAALPVRTAWQGNLPAFAGIEASAKGGSDSGSGGDDGSGHDAGDDHGGDGPGHDAGDDNGADGSDDGAGHDVGDDSGASGDGVTDGVLKVRRHK